MPHQCVNCGRLYEEGSREILHGCDCKGRLFFYVKREMIGSQRAPFILTASEQQEIAKDVRDMVGGDIDDEKPIVLDIEGVNIVQPGKYELDLVNLFRKRHPLVYRLEDGKYMIDLPESFKKFEKKKR